VGVQGGRIVEVDKGDLLSEGKIDINADDRLLTPGFFDIHRHSDWTLLVDPSAESAIEQGLTTEVLGNCGFGPAPAVDKKRVEQNILGHSAKHGIRIDWTTFGEYLDRLDRDLGINVVPLVAHGSIRTSVMGVKNRPAGEDEIDKMCYWVDEALDSGAFGLSAGLEYAPYQTSTATDEIIALVKRVGKRGGLYATHTRYRIFNTDKGVSEAIQIAREGGSKLQISHITPRVFAGQMTEAVLKLCDDARDSGLDVGFDIYPYEWAPGPLTELLPGWALEGTVTDVVRRFKSDQFKKKIKQEHNLNLCRWIELDRWDKLIIVGAPKRPDIINKSIAQLAEEGSKDPWDVVFDLLAEAETHYTDLTEITHTLDWEDILLTIKDRHCSFGSDSATLSRNGPLKNEAIMPGCYGFVPRVFDEVVTSRKALTFEEAVRRLTSLPASQLSIWDRGIIRPRLVADLCLIDPKNFRDNTTWTDFYARPGGVDLVLISGQVAVENGRATGLRAGKILRAT
jgi:N-acyl-D-aspartate/D-glutamate deacylase